MSNGSLLHQTSVSLLHQTSVSPLHQTNASPLHQTNASLLRQTSAPLLHQINALLLHQTSASLPHQTSASLLHQINALLLHRRNGTLKLEGLSPASTSKRTTTPMNMTCRVVKNTFICSHLFSYPPPIRSDEQQEMDLPHLLSSSFSCLSRLILVSFFLICMTIFTFLSPPMECNTVLD